jgi:hypothetical protein
MINEGLERFRLRCSVQLVGRIKNPSYKLHATPESKTL